MTSKAVVQQLHVYPVKGLNGRSVHAVNVVPGLGIVGDRAFALQFADRSPPEGDGAGRLMPFQTKDRLAVQNDWPALAALTCEYDEVTRQLSVREGGQVALHAMLTNEAAFRDVDAYFSAYLARHQPAPRARHPEATPVRLIGGEGTRYPDRAAYDFSVMNLASLRALSAQAGQSLDMRRFRGNVIIDGWEPWSELTLIGKRVVFGDAEFEVRSVIKRCLNTSVHPDRGVIDLNVLGAVGKSEGKGAFGILLNAASPSSFKIGDEITIL